MPSIPEIQVCHERRVALWQTPRCASTTLARWAYGEGFVRDDSFRDPDFEHYAVVRDPYDRYLSTVVLCWYQMGANQPPWRDFIERIADHEGVWTSNDNIHFRPQFVFRAQMPNENLVTLRAVSTLIAALGGNPSTLRWWNSRAELAPDADLALARRMIPEAPVRGHYATDGAIFDDVSGRAQPDRSAGVGALRR